MTRLLLLAAKRPGLLTKDDKGTVISEADVGVIREAVRKSSVDRIYERIYDQRSVMT
jgi:hypothetical protein